MSFICEGDTNVSCINEVEAVNASVLFDLRVSTFQHVTDSVILPIEIVVGLILQVINLFVLHGQRIKGLAYTIYLKTLSVTYLMTLPFMIPHLIRKLNLENTRSLAVMLYHAHCEQYFINLFLFSGNLIIVALAAEPLRAIVFPMNTLATTPRRSVVILCSIFLSVAVILLPIPFSVGVQPVFIQSNHSTSYDHMMNNCSSLESNGSPVVVVDAVYRIVQLHIKWLDTIRYIVTAVFEISLIVIVFFIYALLLLRFKLIVKQHRSSVTQRTQSSAMTLTANQQKATVMCLASVTAFLLCNALSAARETLYFIFYLQGESVFSQFRESPVKKLLNCIGNILLVFNFTLNFILQCTFSFQYRKQLRRMFFRKKQSTRIMTPTKKVDSVNCMENNSGRETLRLSLSSSRSGRFQNNESLKLRQTNH